MTARNYTRIASSPQGFTLIEALIALVVLTVGIMGIISLLLMSKNALHQSSQRTLAVSLADAMVERIRINPAAITNYETGGTPLGGASIKTAPPDCIAGTCSTTDLASFDLWNWEQALDGETVELDGANVGGLIDPHACITFTPDDGRTRSGRLNVLIQWRGLAKTSDAVLADGGTACGGADAGADPYRRQVVVNTIVLDETEF